MNNKKQDLIELGAITKPHGVKGDVYIKPFGNDPLTLDHYGPLTDPQGEQIFTITHLRLTSKGMLVAKIKEIQDRNQAEDLRGTPLCIKRDKLPAPDEDEFYHTDLIGLEARLETGEPVGKIIKVENFGAGDLLEIMPQNSQTSLYLSFTKTNVPELHINEGHIIIAMPSETDGEDPQTR